MNSVFHPRAIRSSLLLPVAALLLGACAETAPTVTAPSTGVATAVDKHRAPPLHWAPAVNAAGAGDFAVAADGRVYAAGDMYGLFVAEGSTLKWNRLATFPADATPYSVATSPDGSLYVGTDRGVLRSLDRGATWMTTGLGDGYVRQVATDAKGNVYAGVQGIGGGVLRSDDGGIRWTMVVGPFAGRGGIIDWISVRKDDVLLGEYAQLPQYSRDKGATWDYLFALWELPEWNASAAHMLESSNGTLLVAWARGIARSVDGGQRFEHTYADGNVRRLAEDVASGALYAMLEDGSVLRSMDDGITWSAYTASFRPRNVAAFGVVPGEGLVLGTWDGIWRTMP